MSPLRSNAARLCAGPRTPATAARGKSLVHRAATPGAQIWQLAEHRSRVLANAEKASTALIVESNEDRYSIEGPAGKLSPIPLPADIAMSRPTARHLRNGALASIGLYSIVILVLLALTGGLDRASHVQVDKVDKTALFQRMDQVVPNALAVIQHTFNPRS